MKLVKAYIRRFLVGDVIRAIERINGPRITAIDVKALGDEVEDDQLEIICMDECIERVKETILRHARTGYKGDGLIAISPIEEAISIRTGKNGVVPF
jgi:nitrogen regulatory protein PII